MKHKFVLKDWRSPDTIILDVENDVPARKQAPIRYRGIIYIYVRSEETDIDTNCCYHYYVRESQRYVIPIDDIVIGKEIV